MKRFLITILTFLTTTPSSNLSIWEPLHLRQHFQKNPLKYTIANFGQIPYGHSLFGTIHFPLNKLGCSKIENINYNKNQGTLIIFLERGGCHYAEKVLNAQNVGGGLVLIMNSNDDDIEKILPIEKTQEIVDKIKIPMVLIDKENGNILKKELDHENENLIQMSIRFPLIKKKDYGNIKFILQIDDFRSYELINDFFGYYEIFKNEMNLKIHYKIFKMKKEDKNCLKNNFSFCVVDKNGENSLILAKETLKQLCLLDYNKLLYIKYMNLLKLNCFSNPKKEKNNIELKNCFDLIYEKYINFKTESNISSCLKNDKKKAEKILEQNNDDIKYYLINYSPLIFINGNMYRGNYRNYDGILEAFCNSFEELPKDCEKFPFYEKIKDFKSFSVTNFIFLSVFYFFLGVFFILGVFYFFYRRKLKKKFNDDLDVNINKNLEKYYKKENLDAYSGIKEIS